MCLVPLQRNYKNMMCLVPLHRNYKNMMCLVPLQRNYKNMMCLVPLQRNYKNIIMLCKLKTKEHYIVKHWIVSWSKTILLISYSKFLLQTYIIMWKDCSDYTLVLKGKLKGDSSMSFWNNYFGALMVKYFLQQSVSVTSLSKMCLHIYKVTNKCILMGE